MSNTLAVQIKCKHCDKTFPTQEALQSHMKKVNAGLRGGFRKHRAHPRYIVDVQKLEVKRPNGASTALDRLADISAREEQLLAALEQIKVDKEAAMEDVQREYTEQTKKLAALSTAITVQRRAAIAVKEEMEAHKIAPET